MQAVVSTDIAAAARLLTAGALVGIPTETVYGLAADARNANAVAQIFAAKGRPADHPLIVHLHDIAQLADWARDVPPAALALAERFWPGPLTLILPRAKGVPDVVTGGQDTVGVRIPDHPLTLDLLRAFAAAGGSGAVAAPSANRFGRISPTTAQHVVEELGERIPLVLDGGPCSIGLESTIVDFTGAAPRVLRPGGLPLGELDALLGADWSAGQLAATPVSATSVPRVSGSLDAHYAPRTPMRQAPAADVPAFLAQAIAKNQKIGGLLYAVPPASPAFFCKCELPSDAAGYGRGLYAALRMLDAANCDQIIVVQPPDGTAWAAVRDRLRRACVGSGV